MTCAVFTFNPPVFHHLTEISLFSLSLPLSLSLSLCVCVWCVSMSVCGVCLHICRIHSVPAFGGNGQAAEWYWNSYNDPKMPEFKEFQSRVYGPNFQVNVCVVRHMRIHTHTHIHTLTHSLPLSLSFSRTHTDTHTC